MFLVVGSLLSSQNAGMSETTARIFIPREHTNSTQDFTQAHARLVTSLGLPSLWYKHGLCLIHVTSLLDF